MTQLRRSLVSSLIRALRQPLRKAAIALSHYSNRIPVFDLGLARLSAWLVSAYRAYLSPHKGYHCAHAAAGFASCSEVASTAFAGLPFSAAVHRIEEQFGQCRRSYWALQSNIFDQAWQQLPNFESTADWARLTIETEECCPPGGGPPPPPPPP